MMNDHHAIDHTFAICAYKESSFLEACIQSLLRQTVKSNLIICTSTPNDSVAALAKQYKIPLFVNTQAGGIGADWNFAYACANTNLVTLCHQDDVYAEEYLGTALDYIGKAKRPLIFFSQYYELRQGVAVAHNRNLAIKSALLWPVKIAALGKCYWAKRAILAFGNPICCPAVTYVKSNLHNFVFQEGFRSNLDWDAWERISKMPGSFVYAPKKLMCHRIHEESETSKVIGENMRTEEDYCIMSRFWGARMAKMLAKLYSYSQKGNAIQ